MTADRVRCGSASHVLNGIGLPASNTVTPPSPPRQGSFAVVSTLPRLASSSQQPMWLTNANRDGELSNEMLLGSLAGYMPASAVTYANSAAAAQRSISATAAAPYPSASPAAALHRSGGHDHSADYPLETLSQSVLEGSRSLSEHDVPQARHSSGRGSGTPSLVLPQQRLSLDAGVQGGDVINSPDLPGTRQSITVLKVTRDGRPQEWAQRRSGDSTAHAGNGWSTLGMPMAPAQPPRKASFNQVDTATPRGSASARVLLESIASIGETFTTVDAADTAVPQAVTVAELRQRPSQPQQQQQQQPPLPRPPRHSSASVSTVLVQQPPSIAAITAPRHIRPQNRANPRAPVSAAAKSAQAAPFSMSPSTTSSLVAPTPHNDSRSSRQSSCGAPRSSHGPELSATALTTTNSSATPRHGPSCNGAVREAGEPLPIGPATLQVSTTTLTKTTKKVRYLLPDEPFDPDAPDPSDAGGLTAEEEAALLDPVNYTCAADEVASRYPMLLRRSSAQGGDLLHGRPEPAGKRLENGAPRPTFLLDDGNRWSRATNRPTVATTRDPSGTMTTQLPAPRILQKTSVANNSTAPNTNSEPFPAHQRVAAGGSMVQACNGKEAGGYLLQRHVQQVATGNQLVKGTVFQPPSTGKRHTMRRRREHDENRPSARVLPPQPQHRRRGTMEGLYDEILRRTQQNRRTALPTTIPPTAAPLRVLALPPPEAATRAAPPTTERRRRPPHLSSAEPRPLRRGPGVNPGAAPPSRSSSQPYMPIACYSSETPSGSEMSSRNEYCTPLLDSAPQLQQPVSTPLNETGAAATGSPGPRLPTSVPHPRPGAPQRQQFPSSSVIADYSAAAVLSSGSSTPGYTSGRFSKYNGAAFAPPAASEVMHFCSSGSGKPHHSILGSDAPPPPPPAQAPPSRVSTACTSPAGVTPLPLANYENPRAQHCQRQLSSAYSDNSDVQYEEDEEGYRAAPVDAYDSDTADKADTTTDMLTLHRHGSFNHSEATPAPSVRMSASDTNGAMTEARRSQLQQYNRTTSAQEAPQTSNDTGSSLPCRGPAQPHAEESPSKCTAAAHTGNLPTEEMRQPHYEARPHYCMQGSAAPPPNPSTVTFAAASFSTASAPASVTSEAEYYEAPESASSCGTVTQPIAVSERSEDEMTDSEDDCLVKKGPLVLVFGDEVSAPEGHTDVREWDGCEEYEEQSEYREGSNQEPEEQSWTRD
ncbi:hypothetical protein LBRM_04_0850 [Leishmania braziliensis MHOM/BR/75/M2904]|uniref:Uncharacterized protein n=2 Tax=Leishmania braziliensis TaxID=5660 RepID=A4H3Z9_LEIBR|nr:hypothetical protein LBRM_04_0850 [Leishmania braziliensis MHOM/BR/75/M2904]CAJ2466149.1 unnamed protein product [Leishmania braziliensis]CAM41562.2 hypothetical protein LBRM_04_0850 [Leishmania braziliensis MHOM/BR/75/M2904]SYZ62658.1 hypothetical_protein [Leishmania braziliensis MHOM/BR/75/M2904]